MTQLEFRDGTREVPDHLADMMTGLQTFTLTFEEAQTEANKRLTRDRLNQIGDKVVSDHLKKFGIGR